jgi:hypothetical protein
VDVVQKPLHCSRESAILSKPGRLKRKFWLGYSLARVSATREGGLFAGLYLEAEKGARKPFSARRKAPFELDFRVAY